MTSKPGKRAALSHLLYTGIVWRGLFFASVLLLNIFLARHFGAKGSGWIYYISNLYSFAVLVLSLSLDSSINFYSSRNEIPTGRLLNFSLLWTLLAGTVIFLLSGLFFKSNNTDFSNHYLLAISLFFVCGNLLIVYCSNLFYARKNFILPNLVQVLVNLALVVLLISWHKTGDDKNDWEKFMVVYFGAFLLAGLFMALMIRLFYFRNWRGGLPSATDSRKLMRYALLAFIGNLVFFLLYRVDYLFVDRFCSPGDLGNYIQVSKLGQLLVQFPIVLASVMFPLLAGRNNVNAANLLQPLSRITCFIILLACLLPVVAGGWLFPFIFGATFTSMYIPFLLLVPGVLFLGVHIILASYFAAMANIKANIISTLLGLLVILAGDIIFIPLYKIAAAALVSSLSYFVMMLYSMWVFQKKYPSGWSNFFFLRKGDINMMFRTFKTRLGLAA